MGRARILSHAGEGRYIVEFDYGTELQAKALERIDKLIADIAPRITKADEAVTQAEAAKAQAVESLNTAIDAYVAAMQADPVDEAAAAALRETVDARSAETLEASLNLSEQETVLALIKFEQVQLQTRRTRTAAVTVTESRSVWCADYSLDLTGTVPTCEVVGEQGEIVIHPAALRSAPWSMQTDGFLLSRELMSPEQAFFNAAILPGWQRFKPIHRIGVIASLNLAADTASVVLEPATSSAAALPITPPGTLQNVPVQYMDCGATAFENGDRVVVKMRQADGTAEAIIGFAANPRECVAEGFLVTGPAGVMLLYRDEATAWDAVPLNATVQSGGYWVSADGERRIRYLVGSLYNVVRRGARVAIGANFPRLVAAAVIGDHCYALTADPATGAHAVLRGPAATFADTAETVVTQSAIDGNYRIPYARWPAAATSTSGKVRTGDDGKAGLLAFSFSTAAVAVSMHKTQSIPESWGEARTVTRSETWTWSYDPVNFPPGTPWRGQRVGYSMNFGSQVRETTAPIFEDAAGSAALLYRSTLYQTTQTWTYLSASTDIAGGVISITPSWDDQVEIVVEDERGEWLRSTKDGDNPSVDWLQNVRSVRRYTTIYLDPNNPAVWFVECYIRTYVYAIGSGAPRPDVSHIEIDPLTYQGVEYVPTEGADTYRWPVLSAVRRYAIVGGVVHTLDGLAALQTPGDRESFPVGLDSPFAVVYEAAEGDTDVVTAVSDMSYVPHKEAPDIPPYTGIRYIHVPKSAAGDTCVSFTFPGSDVTFNYLSGGSMETLVGAKANYRPLNII